MEPTSAMACPFLLGDPAHLPVHLLGPSTCFYIGECVVVWMTHLFGLLGLTGVLGGVLRPMAPQLGDHAPWVTQKKHCGYKAREDKALGAPGPRGGRWPLLAGTAAQ